MSWPYTMPDAADRDGPDVGVLVEAGERIVPPPGTALVWIDANTTYGLPCWLIEAFAGQCTHPAVFGCYAAGGSFCVPCIATAEQVAVLRGLAGGVRVGGLYLFTGADDEVARCNLLIPPLPQAIIDRMREQCIRQTLHAWEELSHDARDEYHTQLAQLASEKVRAQGGAT